MEIKQELSLTFDDVLLEPGYAGFLRSQVETQTRLTQNIDLDIPLVSSPMDTVTGSELAIALGRLGGIGIIHRNLTVDDQAHEVQKVKKDNQLVGAAVGASPGYEARVEALADAEVDVIVIDTAHGFALEVIDAVKRIKQLYDFDVVAGNIATADGARALIDAGADALRVGMGPGAICTTRIVSGMGVPQFTAIVHTAQVAREHGIPVIADGGIRQSGDITKAIGAGAHTVMLGGLFARTEEACSRTTILKREEVPDRFKSIINGKGKYAFKEYRGMGSLAAIRTGIAVKSEGEFHGQSFTEDDLIAEGVEGLVPCTGDVRTLVLQLVGGLKAGMYDTGARTIEELHEKARFARITEASKIESHPHDLFVTHTGGNYR